MKPTNRELSAIFDTAAESYDSISNPYTVRRRVTFVVRRARGKCLEVGAGTGVISKALTQAGFGVTACDISPKMVKVMKGKGLNAKICDAEKLPFKKATFDTVVASEVLYLLDHPERFLKEASRVLKPSGKLLLTNANDKMRFLDTLRTVFRRLGFTQTYFDDRVHRFSKTQELNKQLAGTGFKIKSQTNVVAGLFVFTEATKAN